jgi:hypothetical protein
MDRGSFVNSRGVSEPQAVLRSLPYGHGSEKSLWNEGIEVSEVIEVFMGRMDRSPWDECIEVFWATNGLKCLRNDL